MTPGSKTRQQVEPPYWKKPISSPLATRWPGNASIMHDDTSAMPTKETADLADRGIVAFNNDHGARRHRGNVALRIVQTAGVAAFRIGVGIIGAVQRVRFLDDATYRRMPPVVIECTEKGLIDRAADKALCNFALACRKHIQ